MTDKPLGAGYAYDWHRYEIAYCVCAMSLTHYNKHLLLLFKLTEMTNVMYGGDDQAVSVAKRKDG